MTRVIKVGGRAQQNPGLAKAIAEQWELGVQPMVIVHGGGDGITKLQAALGIESRFVGGRRVTSAADVDVVRMALSGLANKQLVAALVSEGVAAVGLSGEDDGLIGAAPRDADALGHVGDVMSVRPELLHALIRASRLPVISPLSRNVSRALGPALNVNGDDAAAVIAIAMEATELLLMSDVPGVLVNDAAVPTLNADSTRSLVASGIAVNGMVAKLEAALVALEGGVPRVRIGDLSLLSDPAAGTTITLAIANRHSVRSSRDVQEVAGPLAGAGVRQ